MSAVRSQKSDDVEQLTSPVSEQHHSIRKFQLVPRELVDRFLVLYPKDKRMIAQCEYSSGELKAHLVPRDIEYSTARPDYYTASQLVEAISQMGYLLSGLAMLDDGFETLPGWAYEIYLKRIISLECYYINLNLSFRSKLLKSQEQILSLTCARAVYTNTKMIAKMEAHVNKSFKAEATLYMRL